MSVTLPKHCSLLIEHNPHLEGWESMSVAQYIVTMDKGFKPEQWTGELSYQKANDTNELWVMTWTNTTKISIETGDIDADLEYHTFYGATFADLMKLMITNTPGDLAEYA